VILDKRYIALVPRLTFVDRGERAGHRYVDVERDDSGHPIVAGYAVHHNAKLYEKPGIARREANAFVRIRGVDSFGRVLVCDLDELPLLDATPDEAYERDERLMLEYTDRVLKERARRAGTLVDKSDRDYYERARRTRELRDQAALEVMRQLEAFRPPNYVIEVRKNAPQQSNVCSACGVTWFGREFDALMASPDAWVACLKDPDPKGSDAHIFMMARTREGALAKLLAHIIDGGGFFPMT
jgi:hypothetical protein